MKIILAGQGAFGVNHLEAIQKIDGIEAICTLSLSLNNDGRLGTFFRDNGADIACDDDLADGQENPIDVSRVDVSMNGIELQDREFFAAIRNGREPNASVAKRLPAMQTPNSIEQSLL
jgi:2-hydroxy-4-carboxymuconate semialdehyde hemiacetal dehydrogenase